ncbi:MAG: hypothetical protein C0469_17730 [Cyanobacteria bacterium DS2.3.42]|nr:hypothetical protein [Cyanobacteria bacterium DS2.3.42]
MEKGCEQNLPQKGIKARFTALQPHPPKNFSIADVSAKVNAFDLMIQFDLRIVCFLAPGEEVREPMN